MSEHRRTSKPGELRAGAERPGPEDQERER